jgi:PAS domain S-box-containing protein
MSERPPSAVRDRLGDRLVRAVAAARTRAEGTDGLLREGARATGARVAVLWVLDERTGALRWGGDWSAAPGAEAFREACRRITFTPGVGLVGEVVERDAPVVAQVEDLPREEPARAAGLRSVVAAPLRGPDGPLGVLELWLEDAGEPDAALLEDLQLVSGQVAGYLGRLRVEDRLRASEERSSSIVDAALDCVVAMDHLGRIVDFNPMAETTFGYAREDVVGEVLADLIIPPWLRDAHHTALARYVETGDAHILNRRIELTAMRADGTTFPVELAVTRLGSRHPPSFAGFIRDLTTSREAERERERLLREAMTSRAVAEAAQTRSERAQDDAEAAQRRLTLLARAGERMIAGGDYERTMQEVAELAVAGVADFCAVDVDEGGGVRRRVAAAPAGADAPTDGDVLRVPLRTPRRRLGELVLASGPSRGPFEPDDVAMAHSLGARCALAIENARLFRERSHIAETLQRSLLPTRLPHVPGLDVATRYRAAGEHNLVGGDFYDFFRSGDGVWTAILGDVAGKGPEAAALTALTRHTLRAGALREPSPMANLRLLNEALLAADQDSSTTRFATVVYTRICRRDGRVVVTVSTGGHLPPVVVHADGSMSYVPIRGTLLGALEDVELDEEDVELRPGDLMLLYTDGVTEVRPRDPGFGERLLEQVLRDRHGAPAAEIVDAIDHAVVDAQVGEPRDDIALIAVRAVG